MPKANPNRLRRGTTRLPAITITVDDDLARAVEAERPAQRTASQTLVWLAREAVTKALDDLKRHGKRIRLEEAQREVEEIKAELEGGEIEHSKTQDELADRLNTPENYQEGDDD